VEAGDDGDAADDDVLAAGAAPSDDVAGVEGASVDDDGVA
jgi:hypothetical protein